jgi:hypothetical protein
MYMLLHVYLYVFSITQHQIRFIIYDMPSLKRISYMSKTPMRTNVCVKSLRRILYMLK